jgi:photosystem II stability/assembly factor-like uncharacterized protein
VPPPAGTYVNKLLADPDNSRLLYAATLGSGLYRSRDGGDSWQGINPAAELTHFAFVLLDPLDAAKIYAGGRETGLWISPDEGDTWQRSPTAPVNVIGVVVDPRDSQRFFLLAPDGVYRSTTGPEGTWQHVFDYPAYIADAFTIPWPDDWGVRLGRFQHLTLDPHDSDRLYLGARWEGGYHQSKDGGETWEHHQVGPLFRRVDLIRVDPVNPDVLYAGTHHQGLFKSYNRGQSWVSSSHGIAPQKRTPHYGAVLISGLAFDPQRPGTLYTGSDYSNWKSSDGGATWQELGSTLSCEFARSFLVTPETVFAGTNVGIFRSFDGGQTWESCNRGLPTKEVVATVRGKVNGEEFEFALANSRPSVWRRSLDQGGDWVSINWLLYEKATALRFDNETLTITTAKGEYHSTDGGLRWDVPTTAYETKELSAFMATAVEPPPPDENGNRHLTVVINHAPTPDDSLVDAMYQRPPYISLALVRSGYPENGSTPLWEEFWETELAGTLVVPEALLQANPKLILRVEVRDFQYGTRIGTARLNRHGPTFVDVEL